MQLAVRHERGPPAQYVQSLLRRPVPLNPLEGGQRRQRQDRLLERQHRHFLLEPGVPAAAPPAHTRSSCFATPSSIRESASSRLIRPASVTSWRASGLTLLGV